MSLVSPVSYELAEALVKAEAANRLVETPAQLRQAGIRLAALCQELSCQLVVAASREAEALVASAVLMAEGALSARRRGLPGDRVLLIDSAVITANSIYSIATDFKNDGSDWIGAAVYHRFRPDLDGLDTTSELNAVFEIAPNEAANTR